MLKRTLSKGIPCPGCQAKFDLETHVPFMGSCGHSLCGVCVNEKEIKDCPVCNKEGGFTWNQKNELAIEFLVSAAAERGEEDSQNPRLFTEGERSSPVEVVPEILDPTNRTFLARIVNQLDVNSFINLASSCNYLNEFCFNSNDVKITDDISIIFIRREVDFVYFHLVSINGSDFEYTYGDRCDTYLPLDNSGYKNGFLSSSIGRKMLQKYPFVFNLERLHCRDLAIGSEIFPPLRSFFAEFPIQKIIHLDTYSSILEDWNGTIQFLKDFNVEFVEIAMEEDILEVIGTELMNEAFTYFLQNLKGLECDGVINERLILDATLPKLRLEYTSISKNTFLDLIPKLADMTGEIDWIIGCQTPFDLDYETLVSFNVKPFDYEGPVPDHLPIFFIKEHAPQECWLLRNDGKVLKCDMYEERISIFMCPSREYPRSLPQA